MSYDDIRAEHDKAGAVKAATSFPFLGLTLGTDGSWSARFWEKVKPKTYVKEWCESVRVIGEEGLSITFMEDLLPAPSFKKSLERTVSVWGAEKQQKLARLKIGVIGAGSVGSIVAETLARMGVQSISLMDFDDVEEVNLDRLLHATKKDIGSLKVEVLSNAIKKSATANDFVINALSSSIVEDKGFREAIDCDILFSCVDRPWPRSVLNLIAYGHLIPVIDGGIGVVTKEDGTLRSADWKAHCVFPGRRCMECLKQYDPAHVQLEREGYLDDPTYIKSLTGNHPFNQNQNVFAFGLDTASLEILQMLSIVISPLRIADLGTYNYHFVTGQLDIHEAQECNRNCPYTTFVGLGDNLSIKVTGKHPVAEAKRKKNIKRKNKLELIKSLIRKIST